MIKVERDKDNDCLCDGCEEVGTDFNVSIVGLVINGVEISGNYLYMCEKCLTELKNKIGLYIY